MYKSIHYVISFFDRYAWCGQKRTQYEAWKRTVKLVAQGKHVTREGLNQISAIKKQMKRG